MLIVLLLQGNIQGRRLPNLYMCELERSEGELERSEGERGVENSWCCFLFISEAATIFGSSSCVLEDHIYHFQITEQITFSVNRTTNKHGVYNLEIPTIDGVNCVEGLAVTTLCQVSLIRSSFVACNVPVLKTTSNVISVKSKQDNLCIYLCVDIFQRYTLKGIVYIKIHYLTYGLHD